MTHVTARIVRKAEAADDFDRRSVDLAHGRTRPHGSLGRLKALGRRFAQAVDELLIVNHASLT